MKTLGRASVLCLCVAMALAVAASEVGDARREAVPAPAVVRVSEADVVGSAPPAVAAQSMEGRSLSSATYNLFVVLGWNFVSIPLTQGSVGPADFTLPGFLDHGGENTAMWDRAMYYNPLDATDPWKQYYKGWDPSLNDFRQITNTMGFYLHIVNLQDGVMAVGGPEFAYPSGSTLVPLFTGWNMMGFPSNQAITVGAFKTSTGAQIVEGLSGILPNTYVMKAGEGYWVRMQCDAYWLPGWY